MPNLQDKLSEPPFPSELNPLTNPVLERNLGRWAQVYFSTPPAKRQQAVSKLLEEIQRETGAKPAEKTIRPYFARDEKFHSALCSACQHQNPPGHRFCSRCGLALHPAQPDPAENRGATEVGEAAPPRVRERCAVAARPGLQRSGRIGRSAEASMEISAGRGRACVGRFRVSAVGPETQDRSGVIQYCAAGECSGGFASARFFAGRIQSTRSDFGGAQNARGPEYGDHRGP